MISAGSTHRNFVGLDPWLPWPLRAWSWWTEPVRAEKLAVLRIGLAAVLLIDIVFSYWPHLHDFFGPESLGSADLFEWYNQPPHWHLSILRGLGHSLLSSLALGTWIFAGATALLALWGRRRTGDAGRHIETSMLRWVIAAWIVAGLWFQLGLEARELVGDKTVLCWLVPLGNWSLATAFLLLTLRSWQNNPEFPWRLVLTGWLLATLLLILGLGIWFGLEIGRSTWSWRMLTEPGDASADLLQGAAIVWTISVVALLAGFWTRTSAVMAWILSTSFANLNPNIDNAGDTVRGIILFYLMLCPCGAAWSADIWWARKRGRLAGPVFVSPWALRLLFVQMALIYFCNGLYKMAGADWRSGSSLYYVLADLTLARFSYGQITVPYWLTQAFTWSVLVWEVGFPLWVAAPLTRKAALWLGVAFHLAIIFSLEIGGFGPYMLVLYLPLVPCGDGNGASAHFPIATRLIEINPKT